MSDIGFVRASKKRIEEGGVLISTYATAGRNVEAVQAPKDREFVVYDDTPGVKDQFFHNDAYVAAFHWHNINMRELARERGQ